MANLLATLLLAGFIRFLRRIDCFLRWTFCHWAETTDTDIANGQMTDRSIQHRFEIYF